jgi:hypothetical protein|tara:strand:+ start:348 stop:626 length:279 start_codon:yes stop_codon:yes gene_type:complete
MSEPKKRGRKPHTEEQRKAAKKKHIEAYASVNVPKNVQALITQAQTVFQRKVSQAVGVPDFTVSKGQALTAIVKEWLTKNDPTGELRKGEQQ